ncbi:YjcQ family protein [Anaerococcus sp. Marseille-P3915]|uniref:YjcQ family protein n=1 Tax=Anaerococcus sp. Marseille-P3915 TaxID=2057799 RepID=UPI000D0B632C|nr:YjcQ family protein [Anaerococcus sp. Marseille-P3915]
MIENFKIILKILTSLNKSLDEEYFDSDLISASTLGITEMRRNNLLEMLYDAGYIKGLTIKYYVDGDFVVTNLDKTKITLKGLEYLETNTIFKRIQKAAKGINEMIPGA